MTDDALAPFARLLQVIDTAMQMGEYDMTPERLEAAVIASASVGGQMQTAITVADLRRLVTGR